MSLHLKKLAVRVSTVITAQTICVDAVLDHTVMAYRPIFNITRTCHEDARKVWMFPDHSSPANFTVLLHTVKPLNIIEAFRFTLGFRAVVGSDVSCTAGYRIQIAPCPTSCRSKFLACLLAHLFFRYEPALTHRHPPGRASSSNFQYEIPYAQEAV